MDAPCEAPAACRDSRLDNAHVVPTLHRIYLHVHETWKGRFARARARTAVAWFEIKFRIKFRIIFQNICITFPLCSREHASSILESIAASPVVAGRAFSLREGVRVHTFAKSPTSVCVWRCNYPAGIRVSKVHSSKWLCLFQVSNRYTIQFHKVWIFTSQKRVELLKISLVYSVFIPTFLPLSLYFVLPFLFLFFPFLLVNRSFVFLPYTWL